MSDTWPKLVEEARLVSEELIRCAILWHELWHEALDDASRLYFQASFSVTVVLFFAKSTLF